MAGALQGADQSIGQSGVVFDQQDSHCKLRARLGQVWRVHHLTVTCMNFSRCLAALLAAPRAPAASALSCRKRSAMEAHNPDLRAAALGCAAWAMRRGGVAPGDRVVDRHQQDQPRMASAPDAGRTSGWTVGLGWTWERGGGSVLRIRQADALLEVAGLEMLDARRRQQVALHETYFALKGAQERAQIADANRQFGREMAAADKQVATGAMAPVDRARLAVDDLAADAAREALDLRDARHALGLLLGRDDSHDLSADDPWPDPAGRVDTRAFDPQQRAPICARHARAWPRPTPVWHWRAVSAIATSSWVWRPSASRPDISGVTWEAIDHSRSALVTCTRRDPACRAPTVTAPRWSCRCCSAKRAELDQLQASAQSAAQRRSDYEGLQSDAARRAVQGIELAYRRGAASLTDLLDARRSCEFEAALIEARADHAIALARGKRHIRC